MSLGPVMTQRLVAKGVDADRIVEICNWATGALGVVRGADNALLTDWSLQGRFVLLYSGNLGIGHEFDTLLSGVDRARRTLPTLVLVIIGAGARLQEVKARVAASGLEDFVRFTSFVPADKMPESLGVADLAVVTLRTGFEGLIVPSKLLGYMARAIPVLYIGPPSDIGAYLKRFDCGVAIENGNAVGVARAIETLSADAERLDALGSNGRTHYDAELAREHGLARYEALVAACLSTGQDRSTMS